MKNYNSYSPQLRDEINNKLKLLLKEKNEFEYVELSKDIVKSFKDKMPIEKIHSTIASILSRYELEQLIRRKNPKYIIDFIVLKKEVPIKCSHAKSKIPPGLLFAVEDIEARLFEHLISVYPNDFNSVEFIKTLPRYNLTLGGLEDLAKKVLRIYKANKILIPIPKNNRILKINLLKLPRTHLHITGLKIEMLTE